MPDTFASEIRAFIVTNFLFGQDSTPFDENQSFLESGIIDSTGLLELVSFVEQRYDIQIGDRELIPENLDSLHNISQFVARKLGAAEAKGSYTTRRHRRSAMTFAARRRRSRRLRRSK